MNAATAAEANMNEHHETAKSIFQPRKLNFAQKLMYDMAVRGLSYYLNDMLVPGHVHNTDELPNRPCRYSHKFAKIILEVDNHILEMDNGEKILITKDILIENFNRMPPKGIYLLTVWFEKNNHKISFGDQPEKYDLKTILLM
jgi:hypothetical protein